MRLNCVKKFKRNLLFHARLNYRRFSTFSSAILGGGSQLTELSQGCVNLTSLNLTTHQMSIFISECTETVWEPGWWEPTVLPCASWLQGAIITALHFCFTIRISCCFFKRRRLKVEWCFKRRQILHFWPYVKIRGGAISLYQLLKLNLRPSLLIW